MAKYPTSEQLEQHLSLFHPTNLHGQSSTATASKLTVSAYYDMDHPVLSILPDAVVGNAPAEASSGLSAPQIDMQQFVRTCFAEMGRKQ